MVGGEGMESNERIRQLRKDVLKMSMSAFGKELGVSKDVIYNLETNRWSKPEQKLYLIKLISKTFNIREEWILSGEEPMYKAKSTIDLDELLNEQGIASGEGDVLKKLVNIFVTLKPETRREIITNFEKYFSE